MLRPRQHSINLFKSCVRASLRTCSSNLSQHPHVTSWQRLSIEPLTRASRDEVKKLTRLTTFSADRALILQNPKNAATMWNTITKHKLRIAEYRPLLFMNLEELSGVLPQQDFAELKHRIKLEPYLGAQHLASVLNRESAGHAVGLWSSFETDQELMKSCSTLIRAAQVIRKKQLGMVQLTTLKDGEKDRAVGEPCVLLGPAAMRHLWRIAQSDALELRLPADRSVELLDWVAERVVLRHKNTIPPFMATRLVHERALAYGAFGDWDRALLIVKRESGVLPHFAAEHRRNFMNCCRVQRSWESALSLTIKPKNSHSLTAMVQFAPSWEHAARAASHHLEPPKLGLLPTQATTTTSALLLADVLVKRRDVSWSAALHCLKQQCVGTPSPAQRKGEIRVLFRVLNILSEKTPYPFSSTTACELFTAAATVESVDHQMRNESQQLLSASLFRDGRVALTQSVSLCSQGRWDIAVSLLAAAAHQDVACSVHDYLRHTVLKTSEIHSDATLLIAPPPPVAAYREALVMRVLPTPPSTNLSASDALLYDARVLAVCHSKSWSIQSLKLISFREFILRPHSSLEAPEKGPQENDNLAILDFLSPRTTSIISSLQSPLNPFTALRPTCFFVHNRRAMLQLLHSTTYQDRSNFRTWLNMQHDATPVEDTVRRHLWSTILDHIQEPGSSSHEGAPLVSTSTYRRSLGVEVKLDQIPTTPLQFAEARQFLRRVTNGRADSLNTSSTIASTPWSRALQAAPTRVNTTDDWHGLLVLVILSSAVRQQQQPKKSILPPPTGDKQERPPLPHNDGGTFTFVGCEGRLLRSTAALYARGAISDTLPSMVRDIGILTTLSASRSDDVSLATVSSIIGAWPSEEIKKFPMAACLAGYARGLEGQWESALQFFSPHTPPLQPTGVHSYDALIAALRLHLRGVDLPLSWALFWLECALTIPNRNASFMLARYTMSQYIASSNLHEQNSKHAQNTEDVRGMFRILRAARVGSTGNYRSHDEFSRLVDLGDDVATGRRLTTGESLRLSAALYLVRTKQEFLPLASRVGRPLEAREIRPFACRRIFTILPWETALSFFADADAHHGGRDCDSLAAIVGRCLIPNDALRQVVQFAGARAMTQAAALARGLLLLRSGDTQSIDHSVRLIAKSLSTHDDPQQHSVRLGAVALLQLAEYTLGAALTSSVSVLTVATAEAMRDLCRRVCDKEEPLWTRDWRRSCDTTTLLLDDDSVDVVAAPPPLTTSDPHEESLAPRRGDIKPILMAVYVASRLAQAKQYPMPAFISGGALRLASRYGEWGAALHFFTQLRKPRADECAFLASSLQDVHWKLALKVYTQHARLLAVRPDVMCAALLCATAAARRMVDGGYDNTPPSTEESAAAMEPESIGVLASKILEKPLSVLERIRDLARVQRELDALLSFSARVVAPNEQHTIDDDCVETIADGTTTRHQRGVSMSRSLVATFDSRISVWKTAMNILSLAVLSSDPIFHNSVSEELHHDIRECLIAPVERARAVHVASIIVNSDAVRSIIGSDNINRLQMCATDGGDLEGEDEQEAETN